MIQAGRYAELAQMISPESYFDGAVYDEEF